MPEEPIQVLAADSPAPPSLRRHSRSLRLGLIGTAVLISGLSVGLLPKPAVETAVTDASLAPPVPATTFVVDNDLMVGVVAQDRGQIAGLSSFDGYDSLAGPAAGPDGAWWVIAGRDADAVVLRSENEIDWSASSTIKAAAESSLQFGDLIAAEGGLVAIGYELVPVGGVKLNRLYSWHSSDGLTWSKERIDEGLEFNNMGLVESGDTMLATFTDRDGIHRLWRRTTTDHWMEIHLGLPSAQKVIQAPQGGFMVSNDEGGVLTSAFGVIWKRNGAIDPGFYSQWGDRAVALAHNAILVMDAADVDVIELPDDLRSCEIEGGRRDLVAVCIRPGSEHSDIYVSSDGLHWFRGQAPILGTDLVVEGSTASGVLISVIDENGLRSVIRASR
jgi:hypothetical protein